MKTYTLAFLATWLGFALNFAYAQSAQGKISGQVLDAAKQPAIAATITLVRAKDSAIVKTTLADVQGKFVFDKITTGDFKVWITAIGFKKYRTGIVSIYAAAPAIQIPAIALQAGGTTLKEVGVTAQKGFIEQKIDRTVVNVNASISNTGANALEVLEKVPGVTVDENGTISFKGKTGVMIMVDDKPTYLSGDNLASYLRSLPASMLDQIELMPNPPAKYDAAGNAGVINIKIKKSRAKGFNGSFAAAIGKAVYWRTNESLNVNYYENKVNLFANLVYNFNNNYRRLDVGRHYFNAAGTPTSNYVEEAYFHSIFSAPNLKAGMDYYVSPKTTIGFVFTGAVNWLHTDNPVNSRLTNGAGVLDSTIIAQNRTNGNLHNGGLNFNYSHQYDSLGKAITFDLDYLKYNNHRDQDFQNGSYNNQSILKSTQHITDNQPSDINIYSAKTDYTLPLKHNVKLAAGLKSSYVNIDNAVNYFNIANNITTVDNNNTNRFLYKENINAAYLNFNKDWKRFSVQAGVRAENTNVKAHQLGNALGQDSSFAKHYVDLFPTGFILYKLDSAGSNTLNLSYGRRIDRPGYQDLNPFIVILDKYSAFAGNPFLKPQYSDLYEFTYSYKSIFSLAFEYNVIKDYQVEYDFQKGDIFFANSINLGRRRHENIGVSTNLDPAKWWKFYFYAEINNAKYQGPLGAVQVNVDATYFYFSTNNQFNLSHGWSAELGMFYVGPNSDSQFSHIAREQVNGGLQKKILNNKGAVKIGVRDLFRGNYSAGNINNIPGAAVTYHNDNGNRAVTWGFTYSFGKSTDLPKKRNTGSADSEKNRVGN